MSDTHLLKTVLNLHLASDASAALHLPYILNILSPEVFATSPHLTKWLLRVNSLLHSKDASAKWSGLCLVHATSLHSKSLMIENAQSWIQVALPILSVRSALIIVLATLILFRIIEQRSEPAPVTKAALAICRIVFTVAIDVPEFQRQVSTPNVPKFTAALIQCIENASIEMEVKVLALKTMTRLIPIYPNIHRANHASLSALTLRILLETHGHVSRTLSGPAAELHAVLHLTGGKVGAATLWRKSVDERLADAWTAFGGLRTTFGDGQGWGADSFLPPECEPVLDPALDPAASVSLNLERLRSSILTLCHLLRSPTSRPVQVPIGPLVKFIMTLIAITEDEQAEQHFAPALRALETAVIPSIHKLACELTSCLAKCVIDHLTPYLTRICTYVAFHLEQKLDPLERLSLLQTLDVLLASCRPLSSPILSTRLTRAVVSLVKSVLPSQADAGSSADTQGGGSKSRKGKKRARGYEGDEVFKTSISVICPSIVEGKVLLTACDVLQKLLRNSDVSLAIHSLACRVVLAAMLHLPQLAAGLISPDPQVYQQLMKRLQNLAMELSEGTTSAMGKSLGLVIHALSTSGIEENNMHDFDVLLHPRLPPLLRSLPQIEALSLFRTEESEEEAAERQRLGIEVNDDPQDIPAAALSSAGQQDVIMNGIPPQENSRNIFSAATTSHVPQPLADPSLPPRPPTITSNPVVAAPVDRMKTLDHQVDIPQAPDPSNFPTSAAAGTSTSRVLPRTHMSDNKISVTQTPREHEDEQMPSIDVDSDSESE
ncbi:hypothetical protein PQX77_003536 [Marasmius sp. AFHP31]|nr:hypothetical protein PQX77_003536 [Marasmius sp. AFHP31]